MRLQTIPRLPRAVAVVRHPAQPNRPLWCETCGNWTPHALTKSQTHYVCGLCATQIIYLRLGSLF